MGDNGQVEKKFDQEIHIFRNSENKEVAVSSNINDMTIGSGMCDVAKDLIKAKIAIDNKPKIQKSNGILNFVRRR